MLDVENIDVQTPPAKKVRLNKSIKQCPHCKRVDHQRITSHLCPKNINFNTINLIEPTVNVNFENGPLCFINTNLAPISENMIINQVMPNSVVNSSSLPRTYSPIQLIQKVNMRKRKRLETRIQNNFLSELNTIEDNNNQIQKNNYLKEFDSAKNGPLHEQTWAKKDIKKFRNNMNELKQFYCYNCHEMWPSRINLCKQCKLDPIKFSKVI